MGKRAATINLQGNDYAKVAERVRLFREDCPDGIIETSFEKIDDSLIFRAVVIKDGDNPKTGKATGHSTGDQKKSKDFEKLESIAVGRALANLGYLASGEIASSEEMEEYTEFKKHKKAELSVVAIEKINECDNLDKLMTLWATLGNERAEQLVIDAKDKRKAELSKAPKKKKELANAVS